MGLIRCEKAPTGERGRAGMSENVTNRHFSLLTGGSQLTGGRVADWQGGNKQKRHKDTLFFTDGGSQLIF